MSGLPSPRWPHAGLVAALALATLMTLPLLGARDLWAPDEPRYAQVAAEMLEGGHWWFPHVNGREYPDKPPLYFWLAAAAGAPGGRVTETAARLPSALAHLLLVALTYLIGRRLFDRRAATIAALALSTLWLEAWMARRACLDVLLSLCVAGAIAAMLAGRDAVSNGRTRVAALWWLLAGIVTGLGFMTKGPVVLLAAGAASVPILAIGRPPLRARAVSLAAAGLIVVLAAWLVPARVLANYDPMAIAREQVVDRATEGRHHAQPAWYFLRQAPADFLPWTLAIIPAAAWAVRRRSRFPEAMLLAWGLAPLLIHSVIVEKRNIYLLPIAPAWALLCGAWFAAATAEDRGPRRVGIAWAALLGLLAVGALVIGAGAPAGELADEAAETGLRPFLLGLGFLALAGAAWLVHALRRQAEPVRLAVIAALAFGSLQAGLFYALPRLDALKSGRSMGEAVRALPPSAPVGMHPRTWDAYVYYSGRPVADMSEHGGVASWLARQPRPAHLLAYDADLGEIPADGDVPPAILRSSSVGHRTIHLLRYSHPVEIP